MKALLMIIAVKNSVIAGIAHHLLPAMIQNYPFNEYAMKEIQISSIDIRLAHTRHKDTSAEKRLLMSIQERDIQEPLQVAHDKATDHCILLDGFKRYRCAMKLNIHTVPVDYIGSDIVIGIVTMLRREESKGITTIEQAALIDELHQQYGLSISEIATLLERSPSWVKLRLGMIEELSPLVREKLMSGAFPVRAYMYGIKGCTRVQNISSQRIDSCVNALSGKHLSTRDLSILCDAYFNGGEQLQQLIVDGDVHHVVRMLKDSATIPQSTNSNAPQTIVDELRLLSTTIKRLIHRKDTLNCIDSAVLQNVNVWCTSILGSLQSFQRVISELYERTKPSTNRFDSLPTGTKQTSDRTTT
jgi:hypothetical protein